MRAWRLDGFGRGERRERDVLLSRGNFQAGHRSPRSSAGAHLGWPAWLQRLSAAAQIQENRGDVVSSLL
jgi:hypothetical protein